MPTGIYIRKITRKYVTPKKFKTYELEELYKELYNDFLFERNR